MRRNKMYVRRLYEIEDCHSDAPAWLSSRNPTRTDPLSRRGFADGNGPAASAGNADAESQQEPVSRLGRDAPASASLDALRAGRRSAPAPAMLVAVRARSRGQPLGAGRLPCSPMSRPGGGTKLPPHRPGVGRYSRRIIVCSSRWHMRSCRLEPD
jgi:hypothetical protein